MLDVSSPEGPEVGTLKVTSTVEGEAQGQCSEANGEEGIAGGKWF